MNVKLKQWIRRNRAPYLFLLPFFISFSIFMLYPILYSLYLSFHQWDGMSDQIYVGLAQFESLFKDENFWIALYNTGYIAIFSLPIQLIPALLLALILNISILKGKKIFRAIFFMPIIVCVVVIAIVFNLLYDFKYGLINYFLGIFKIPPVRWLLEPHWFKLSVVFLVAWRWTGYNMVIMLAGLQGIPSELYEAGQIDGTNHLQSFFYITLPMLKPVLLFCFIMCIIRIFKIFTEPYIVASAGSAGASLANSTMVIFLYKHAFNYFHFGYASAAAYVLMVVIMLVSYSQLKLFK